MSTQLSKRILVGEPCSLKTSLGYEYSPYWGTLGRIIRRDQRNGRHLDHLRPHGMGTDGQILHFIRILEQIKQLLLAVTVSGVAILIGDHRSSFTRNGCELSREGSDVVDNSINQQFGNGEDEQAVRLWLQSSLN